MRIKKIIVARVTLPFTGEFSHSLRKRFSVNNIVVILMGNAGKILGCGEGAPRPYVTGETSEMAGEYIQQLINRKNFPWEIDNVEQIWDFIDSLPGGKEMNASICAIEIALLDALARDKRMQVIDFFPHDYFTDSIQYGAAIPLSSERIARMVSQKIKEIGITRLKLKMGNDYLHNQSLIKIVDDIFDSGYDLKVDINGVWSYETGVQHLALLNEYKVTILEQPMFPDEPDISRLFHETEKYNMKLMADESACSLDDLHKIDKEEYYKIINIRLSKCGGLRRSMQMIDYLRENKFLFQIGCQLGESGLLSSAGRILSLLSNDSLYYDGSYDNLLLAENITETDVSFGYSGKAFPLCDEGLGVNIDMDKVKKLSNSLSIIESKN